MLCMQILRSIDVLKPVLSANASSSDDRPWALRGIRLRPK